MPQPYQIELLLLTPIYRWLGRHWHLGFGASRPVPAPNHHHRARQLSYSEADTCKGCSNKAILLPTLMGWARPPVCPEDSFWPWLSLLLNGAQLSITGGGSRPHLQHQALGTPQVPRGRRHSEAEVADRTFQLFAPSPQSPVPSLRRLYLSWIHIREPCLGQRQAVASASPECYQYHLDWANIRFVRAESWRTSFYWLDKKEWIQSPIVDAQLNAAKTLENILFS